MYFKSCVAAKGNFALDGIAAYFTCEFVQVKYAAEYSTR